MATKNRQHTLELWFHPIGGHLTMAFTYKDWFFMDYCDSAEAHYRFPTKWGLVHVIMFGGISPDKSIAETLMNAVFEGKIKHVKFDDVANGKCDLRGESITR